MKLVVISLACFSGVLASVAMQPAAGSAQSATAKQEEFGPDVAPPDIKGERLPRNFELSLAQRFSKTIDVTAHAAENAVPLVKWEDLKGCKSPEHARIVITDVRVAMHGEVLAQMSESGVDHDLVLFDSTGRRFQFAPHRQAQISLDPVFVAAKGQTVQSRFESGYRGISGEGLGEIRVYVSGYWAYTKKTAQEERADKLLKMNEALQAELLKRELKIAELKGKLEQLELLYKSNSQD
ncbi:MAG TPA: hypothetical protein DDW52_05285 [Planctomycetaceae bacterium]|nr:hypothetical protein [Planctomycetaceae bacterium]